MNAPHQPQATGGSVWVDPASRRMLASGTLQLLMDDGVCGAFYEPGLLKFPASGAIAARSLPGALLTKSASDLASARQHMTVQDAIDAADLLRPLYDGSGGSEGFVGVDVSPGNVRETWRAFEEANALWNAISRPNVLIGVPATRTNLAMIRRLLITGINVNFTLVVGRQHYWEAAQTYLSAIEARLATGEPVSGVTAIATVPLRQLDHALDQRMKCSVARAGASWTSAMESAGGGGIACAMLTYRESCAIQASRRFESLARRGARPLRLHWALARGEGPDYPLSRYRHCLIGTGGICSMPGEAIAPWLVNAAPAATPFWSNTQGDFREAQRAIDELRRAGIDANAIAQQLQYHEIVLRASMGLASHRAGEPVRTETRSPIAERYHP